MKVLKRKAYAESMQASSGQNTVDIVGKGIYFQDSQVTSQASSKKFSLVQSQDNWEESVRREKSTRYAGECILIVDHPA